MIKKYVFLMFVFASTLLSSCTSSNYIEENTPNEESEHSDTVNKDSGFLVTDEVYEVLVHFIDVGQGDSTLIEIGNFHILIDAGDNSQGDLVVDYLYENNVDDIEIMIGTHPDADHIGGLDVVLESFDVNTVIDSCVTNTTKTWEDYDSAISDEEFLGALSLCDDNMTYNITDEIQFEIIDIGDNFSTNNENSVISKLTAFNSVFLFTGDAGEISESSLINYDIDSDVLKVGHHGSNSSTSNLFLEKVTPSVAVISAGIDNKYGHPHTEVLNRINNYTEDIFGTWLSGNIIFITNENGLQYSNNYERVGTNQVVGDTDTSLEETLDEQYGVPSEISVRKGEYATLNIVVEPNEEYSIDVYYKSGESSASGLENKTSDAEGNISWTWKVSSLTTSGTWDIQVKEVETNNHWNIDLIVE